MNNSGAMSVTSKTDMSNSSYTITWNPLNETRRDPVSESVCTVLNLSSFKFHDESKDLMSVEVSNIFNNVIHVVFYPILFFIGFPSNIVNMIVFFRHGLRQRINLCLFCLSTMDIIFVILAFLLYVEKFVDKDFTISYRKYGHVAEILINNQIFGLYSGSGMSSQFISAVIAGERCLCVVWPLRSSAVLKTKTIGLVLLVGTMVIFGLRFVVGMKYRMVCVLDAVTGLKSYYVISSEFYRANKKLVDILDGVVYSLVLNITFCTFVTISTVITAANLKKSTEFHKESSKSTTALSARNVAVTKMLIYLSVQFVVLNTPSILFRVSLVFLPELTTSGYWANLFFFLVVIPDLCGVLSASMNFLIYFFFGSKYRETVLEMLCKRKRVKS